MKKLLIFCFSLSAIFTMQAQHQHSESCFYAQALSLLDQQYPGYLEATRRTFDDAARHNNLSYRGIYKIPVVVHVVWKNDDENLPDSVIYQQIDVLNKAYRRQNADAKKLRKIFEPIVADPMITFELKEIRRKQTTTEFQASLTSLAGLDAVKQTAKGGDDAADPDRFLNIWVCNVKPINLLGSQSPLLGVAYPPAGLSHWPQGASAPTKALEGVIVWHKAFGINKTLAMQGAGTINIEGKTLIHEVGHYLGLRHIWGDGQTALLGLKDCKADDGVADTPRSGIQSQFNCDTTKNSCVDTPIDLPDMVENYMDYSSEQCTNSFTKGQVGIMHAVLEGPRKTLWQSISTTKDIANRNDFKMSPNPTADVLQIFLTAVDNNQTAQCTIFDVNGRIVWQQNLPQQEQQLHTISLATLTPGMYWVKINQTTQKLVKW